MELLGRLALGLAALPAALLTLRLCARAVWHLVWRPYAVARSLGGQGIRGPPYRFAVGCLQECRRMLVAGRRNALDAGCHNYTSHVQPFIQKWTADYGKTFLFWFGPIPSICSTDMELVREVLADRTSLYQKDYMNPSLEVIFGKGLILTNGDDWKRHRKVVHPVFNQGKLKSLSSLASYGAQQMMAVWSAEIQNSNTNDTETEMRHESEQLTLGVIVEVIFGQKTKESWEVFVAMKELQELAVHAILAPPVPGFRYLPTRRNRRTWKLDRLVTRNIMKMMETRIANDDYGEDLLGLMMQACRWGPNKLSNEEIVGECKTFFSAGIDTTATLLTWAMFLISSYPEWQEKLREEILRESPEAEGEVPSINTLGKLKLLNMLLLETLRLYSPVPFLTRKTTADTSLANIEVQKGTVILIPLAMMHRDKEVWGPDADEFNPMRFENGTSRAGKYASSLLAFSYGPRACSGQNFAMIEVQTVIVMMLKRFSFTLSPKYVHKPTNFLTLTPRYGLPLIVRNLQPDEKKDSRVLLA
uniref:Uncharacterized protein n=1 Tax=Avena sativa TaxID=4498 RepID=A0ACD5ZRU3_AVESA